MTDTILRKIDVEKAVGLSERQLRRLEAEGHFPKRVALCPGGRSVGWRASEVQAWIAGREVA
ncbi:MAG: AlpA family phage regulatory protein [Blastomonas sp.]|uniref:helix-turn-helix transcriptional regulator n=1 Tax=Blastomonas sp. TaxID=1909299 RepID=UPI003BE30B7B|nr:AlpA family phage regulatory protein [Blastomonas sp.]